MLSFMRLITALAVGITDMGIGLEGNCPSFVPVSNLEAVPNIGLLPM